MRVFLCPFSNESGTVRPVLGCPATIEGGTVAGKPSGDCWLPTYIRPKRTLTSLYNERPTWLAMPHADLDQAVWDAYGWDDVDPSATLDDAILGRLLELNRVADRSVVNDAFAVMERRRRVHRSRWNGGAMAGSTQFRFNQPRSRRTRGTKLLLL